MSCIFVFKPSKRRPFPFKTGVIWVPGSYQCWKYILIAVLSFKNYTCPHKKLPFQKEKDRLPITTFQGTYEFPGKLTHFPFWKLLGLKANDSHLTSHDFFGAMNDVGANSLTLGALHIYTPAN